MFCLLFSSLFLIFLIALRKKHYHSIDTKSFPLPPGPRPWPVFGCLFEMVRNRPTHKWIQKIMHEMNTDIACIRLGRAHVITVTSPELGREFLKKQDSIFSSRPLSVVAEITSSGYLSIILSPYGDQWKKMKRVLVSNLISPTKHAWLSCKIVEEADHLVYYVHNQCRNSAKAGIVNVRTAARHYSANVMKKMMFNKRFLRKNSMLILSLQFLLIYIHLASLTFCHGSESSILMVIGRLSLRPLQLYKSTMILKLRRGF